MNDWLLPFSFSLPAIVILLEDAKLIQNSCRKVMCCGKMTNRTICEIYDLYAVERDEKGREIIANSER